MAATQPPSALPTQLFWLADAPLFIDAILVERFYDAVVRPPYREGTSTSTTGTSEEKSVSGKTVAEGKVGVTGGFLARLLGATLERKVGGEVGGGAKSGTTASMATQWVPIDTPQRQLEELIVTYYNLIQDKRMSADRLLMLDSANSGKLFDPAVAKATPRTLVLLDLPGQAEAEAAKLPNTTLIPTAAEFANGKIVTLYDQMKADDGSIPPNVDPKADSNTLRDQRRKYWKWFREMIGSGQSMSIVEKSASENQRIRWIDYRVPLSPDCDTLHLHCCPAGAYDTGVFAYNLIKRGYKHGLRIVGTLKSEPDINVLAVYEK